MEAAAKNDVPATAVSGVLWMGGLSAFRDVLQFAVMLVLTRLLAPAAYGQFALVTAIVGVMGVFSFHLFLEHALQQRDGEPDFDLLFTAGAVTQIGLFVAMNAAAWLLPRGGQWAGLPAPLHVMSIFFLLDWPGELRVKMLERALDWRRLRLLQAAALVLGSVAALALAAAGAGVHALLVQALLLPAPFAVDLFFVARWRPRLHWSRRAFAPVWRYARTRMASGITLTGRQMLESTALAAWAGFTPLGMFNRATGLANLCCLKVPSMVTLALFPMLARLEPGSARGRRAASTLLAAMALVVLPAALLLSLIAGPAVRLLYGAQWVEAIPLVPWALAAASLGALSQTASTVLLANLGQRQCLRADVIALAGTAASLWWLLPRGAALYLGGIAVVNLLCLLLLLRWLHEARCLEARPDFAALLRAEVFRPVRNALRPVLSRWSRPVGVRLATGHTCFVDLRSAIGRGILVRGAFDESITAVLRRHLRPGATFVDAGANVGYYSLVALALAGEGGAVHAFEIDPRALRCLRRTRERNGLSNLHLHEVALGARETSASLVSGGDSGHTWAAEGTGAVDVKPLDNWLPELAQLDLIKIDVEGAELEVLRGARGVLEKHRPVVVCEAVDANLERFRASAQSLVAFMDALGYRAQPLEGNDPCFVFEPGEVTS